MSETNLSEDEVKSVDSNISSGEWDTYHENPSFIEPPSGEDLVDQEEPDPWEDRLSSTDNFFLDRSVSCPNLRITVPLEVWPPRNPSSESEFNYAEENLLPKNLLDCIQEEFTESTEEVFFETETMPPKPSAEQINASFAEKARRFKNRKQAIDMMGAASSEANVLKMAEIYDELEELAYNLETTAGITRYNDEFSTVEPLREKALRELLEAQKALEASKSSSNVVGNKADDEYFKSQKAFELKKEKVLEIETDVTKVISETPIPSKASMALINKLEHTLKATENQIELAHVNILASISGLDIQEKEEKETLSSNQWEEIRPKISLLFSNISEYSSKFVDFSTSTSFSKSQLARLPLPTFKGIKTD